MKRSTIAVTQTAVQILRRLHPDIKRSIREGLDDLSENPYSGKPLKIDDGSVTVVFIGPRRDVYERLRDLLLA